MSSAFTSLISKIENYYADRDYTTEDAEHLSQLAIVEYAKTKNSLVASARQVPTASVANIIETAIHHNLDADPSEWMLFAANAVDNVLNYAHEGIIASGLGEYTDFLPLGHPSRTNREVMTASALSRATALWVAGDPRIASDQARLDVYAAYSTKPGSIEAQYANAKLTALVSAGYVPEDVTLPIVAASFFKKMSFAMRSAMSKALAAVRRRHRDGRFAEEFGRLKGFFSRPDGSIFSEDAQIVGAPKGTNNFQIEIKDSPEIPDGIYTIDAAKTAPVKAVLSKRALSKVKGLKQDKTIANPSQADRASAIPLAEFLKTRADAPEGWTKNEDGSFNSKTGQTVKFVEKQPEGDFMTEGAGENGAIDPEKPIFEIRDDKGELLGIGQNWSGLNKIAMIYDALGEEDGKESDEPGFDQKAGGSDRASLIKELEDGAQAWMDDQRFGPDEYDAASDKLPNPEVTADMILDAEKSGDTSELEDSLKDSESAPEASVIKKAIERINADKGFDQKAGEGKNWYDDAIDFDHLSDPQNWSQFKDGEATYTSPDGKLKLTWEPDGEGDVGFGSRDLSGISVEYDGQDVGNYLATQRDLEEGDIADGLEKLFKKQSWFKPENLVKSDDFGNSYVFETDNGSVEVKKERDPKTGKVKFVVSKDARDLIDENREGSFYRDDRFDSFEEAFADAEDFAQTLNDPDKLSDLLNETYFYDEGPGFDQKAGDTPELSATGKEIAKGLGEHKFFYEEDADGNLSGGEDTYTSPDGRVEIKYRDGSWFDDEKGYIPWDEMFVSVDGKGVDTVLRNKGEKWEDFLDRAAGMADAGLENPNYLEDKKAKREADRKAKEDFFNSPEQVAKREEEKFAREQEKIAVEQAREAADKEGLLKKVDDLANRIMAGDSGDDIWVGDEDEDGYRNWGVYNEDGDEIATGNFGPNWDEKDLASAIRDGINSHLDKKLDELEPPAGFDQKAADVKADAPAKPLSEKQMEPATGKQYALLEELNSERDGIDPVTQKAIDDALQNKNLTKAQMASLFGELTKKPFKPNIDPTKPTERQINSLQGYLTTKELSPEEMNDILAQLDAGLDRDSIEKLTAKLRRRPDRQQTEGFDQSSGKTIADTWDELDQDTKDSVTESMRDYLDKLRRTNPDEFYEMLFDVAMDHPDRKRVIEKPTQYADDFIEYYVNEDPELIADMLDNAGVDIDGLDQNVPTKPLSPKMMEPATEAQYNYLKNLSESKADIDPETAQAIKEALEGNNLTKAQAGAFIGKLRDLGDKENMGQYGKPSQKMIDSVKRDVYAKGLSDADREEVLRNLENRSKGDVSSIISMLKEMDDVEGGIEKYIDSLREKGDVEALQRLRADDRYGRWSSQMDDALAKMGPSEQGFDQNVPKKLGYNPQLNKNEYYDLADELENSEDAGYVSLSKRALDDLNLDDVEDGYMLYTELMDAYKAMRPTSEEGKALEAKLKDAADSLLSKIEAELGPIEAAKRDSEDYGASFDLDNAVDDLPDFFDYYYPTDVSDDMRNGDGGMVGDNRGGGWEASVRFNEETGKWEANMSSPGQASESYSQEFDDQDEAADWAANELGDNNNMARNRDTGILAEDGLDGLIAEYGDDPVELAGVLEGIIGWLQSTNRGQAEKIARTLDDYVGRLREQIAKNPKA